MNQINEILAMGLQGRAERERGARTIVEFLRETMNGVDRVERRKSLKERLGLKAMSCCGATWGLMPVTVTVGDDDDEESALPQPQPASPQQPQQERVEVIDLIQTPPANFSDHGCLGQRPAASGMNLATALAAERQYRAAQDSDGDGGIPVGPANNRPETAPQTPSRTSLMRLLEESDGENGERETTEKEERGVGFDCMCCVCMGRKKGAAFIPCGHTFCRVCSRELWLNRGSCPLCNRPILEILDIF